MRFLDQFADFEFVLLGVWALKMALCNKNIKNKMDNHRIEDPFVLRHRLYLVVGDFAFSISKQHVQVFANFDQKELLNFFCYNYKSKVKWKRGENLGHMRLFGELPFEVLDPEFGRLAPTGMDRQVQRVIHMLGVGLAEYAVQLVLYAL